MPPQPTLANSLQPQKLRRFCLSRPEAMPRSRPRSPPHPRRECRSCPLLAGNRRPRLQYRTPTQAEHSLLGSAPNGASEQSQCLLKSEVFDVLSDRGGLTANSRSEARVCSVISNWTGRPVFRCTMVVRSRTLPPRQMSWALRVTRSPPARAGSRGPDRSHGRRHPSGW